METVQPLIRSRFYIFFISNANMISVSGNGLFNLLDPYPHSENISLCCII